MVFGLVDLNVYDFFRCSFEKVRRGLGYKLFLPTCNSSTRFNFFAYIVLRMIWNVLPHDTDFCSLVGFKRSLSTNILQKFLTGSILSVESNQNVESKRKMWSPRLKNVESKIAFGQLILRKIIKTVDTRCQILRLKCTKIQNSAAAPPRPRWESLQRFSRPPSWI